MTRRGSTPATATTACERLDPIDGVCASCGRETAVYNGRPSHKRGRYREARAAAGATIDRAEQLRLGAIMAAKIRAADPDGDVCECGVELATHPELPKPKRLGGWRNSTDGLGPGWRSTVSGRVDEATDHERDDRRRRIRIE